MRNYHEYTGKVLKYDIKDKQILKCLNENCRMTLTEISKRTHIPVDTIKYRIEKLEKEKAFKYAIIMDTNKLGYPIFNSIYMNLVNFTVEKEKELLAYVRSNPYLVYTAKGIGKYDYIVGIVSKDTNQFEKVLNEFKTKFMDIIKDFDIFMVLGEYKYDDLTELVDLD